MPNRTMSWPALAGIIGPIAFVITFTILGLVRDGYSPKAEQISDLGATGTDLAILQDINFIIAGLLILVLAVGMFRLSEFGKGARTGSGFVALTKEWPGQVQRPRSGPWNFSRGPGQAVQTFSEIESQAHGR